MWLFLIGLLIAAAIYLLSAGHVLFLPLLLIIPLGGLFGRRRRRTSLFSGPPPRSYGRH
jgi:hypothetical protein